MTLVPGTSLGPYQVIEQVGRGGMATVYKAYQPALTRYVAVKVLPAFLAEDAAFRERFRTEAITIAKLRHPNILQVHDSGSADDVYYIVSEFVDGGTLAEQLGGPLPLDYVVKMLAPIASALDYAHARGVVHRDVKPSNILLSGDSTPVLSDFGLATMMGSVPRLTQTGAVVGTPEYMAPEQGAGEDPGPAADRYALAVIAYEMLTGEVPYHADTPLATLLAHAHRPLPLPKDRNPHLSDEVSMALMKGLAKGPSDRYDTASGFVSALTEGAAPRRAASGMPTPAAAPRAAPIARRPVAALPALTPRAIAPVLIFGIASLALAMALHWRTSPTASIDLRVSSGEAQEIARRDLERRGLKLAGYQSVTLFENDAKAIAYLQRTLGTERTNEVLRDETNGTAAWYWRTRWFIPGQKEELRTWVSPQGQLVAFLKALDDDAPARNVGPEAARALAEESARSLGVDLGAYSLVESRSDVRKGRTDHIFEWKRQGIALGDAEVRVEVRVAGDAVAASRRYIKVSTEFDRELQREADGRQFLTGASLIALLIGSLVALVGVLRRWRRDEQGWRTPVLFGAPLFVMAFIDQVNQTPRRIDTYRVETDYFAWAASNLTSSLFVAFILAGIVFALVAGGEALARRLYPRALSAVDDVVAGRSSRELAWATIHGYALGLSLMGLAALLRIATESVVHVSTGGTLYGSALSSLVPFLYPLTGGLGSVVLVSVAFFMFAVTMLDRYLRSTWLAAITAGALFAVFTGTAAPPYVGFLLSLVPGAILGATFTRSGLWTVMVAGVVLGAIQDAVPLLLSRNVSLTALASSDLLILVAPALLAFGWRRRAVPVESPGSVVA